MNSKGLMLAGLGMAALGGLLTLGGQSAAAEDGGTYLVFYGLIGCGVLNFLRGLSSFIKEQNRSTRVGPRNVRRPSTPFVPPPPPPRHLSNASGTPHALRGTRPPLQPENPTPKRAVQTDNDGPATSPIAGSWVLEASTPSTTRAGASAPPLNLTPSPTVPPSPPRLPSSTLAVTMARPTPRELNGGKKRGRKLLLLGTIVSVAVAGGLAGALLYNSLSESEGTGSQGLTTAEDQGSVSTKTLPPSTTDEPQPVSAPQGFSGVQGDEGWITYTSAAKGLSISLPAGWKPLQNGRKLVFSASDKDPSYKVKAGSGTPQFQMSRFRRLDTVTPRQYFRALRTGYSQDLNAIGEVERYRDSFPAGQANVFRFTLETQGLRDLGSYSVFMVPHGDYWYQLSFGVTASEGSSYLPVFTSIVRSLSFP